MSHVIISVRITEAVHQRLTIRAAREGITLSDLVATLLRAAVADELVGKS